MGGYSQAQTYKPRGRPVKPGVPCPECESTATWRKGKRRLFCRRCVKYFNVDLSEYVQVKNGNAAWRALRADNGTYKEMWGGMEPPTGEARAELLAICDRMNAEELEQRRQKLALAGGER